MRSAKPREVYAYFIKKLNKYGALQILSNEYQSIVYVLLDYLGPEPPTEDGLKKLKPFYREAYNNHHAMVKSSLQKSCVPRDYIFIGECDLVTDTKCDSYSGMWPGDFYYIDEEKWKSFDEITKEAYKKNINSGEFVTVGKKMFKKIQGLWKMSYIRY